MQHDVLIISDALVEPPSEILPFRTVTMFSKLNLGMEILLHTSQDMKDLYYHWMKPRGMMEFVSYILNEIEWEDGVRLDVIGVYPNTIKLNSIIVENQLEILGQIKILSGR